MLFTLKNFILYNTLTMHIRSFIRMLQFIPEPLRCPFCNGTCCVHYDYITDDNNKNHKLWIAHCIDCNCSVSADQDNNKFQTERQAVTFWNRRYR